MIKADVILFGSVSNRCKVSYWGIIEPVGMIVSERSWSQANVTVQRAVVCYQYVSTSANTLTGEARGRIMARAQPQLQVRCFPSLMAA